MLEQGGRTLPPHTWKGFQEVVVKSRQYIYVHERINKLINETVGTGIFGPAWDLRKKKKILTCAFPFSSSTLHATKITNHTGGWSGNRLVFLPLPRDETEA